jgi:hypothetical protein
VPDPLVAKPARTLTLQTPDKANASMLGELALPLNDMSADYPAMSVVAAISVMPATHACGSASARKRD